MTKVAIIDYGRGNLHSIIKALEHIGANVKVYDDDQFVGEADALVLPGVGAFAEGMSGLAARQQDSAIKKFVETGRPFLGICLGCQLLLSQSDEFGRHEGLNLIPGQVIEIPYTGEAVPNVGWKTLTLKGDLGFESIHDGAWAYFVHSYYCQPDDVTAVKAVVQHGQEMITAVISRDNVYGFQFHPEKSGDLGLQMLGDFVQLAAS